MINFIGEVGLNAGKIWDVLNMNGPLTNNQLIEKTSLTKNEISAAVGWLARENKIRKDGDVFNLGETNLTDEIGVNAGKIWNLLESNNNFFSALGWLAREGKINSEFLIKKSPVGDMQNLKDESDALVLEIEERNKIINELKNQLIDNQTDFVETKGNIEHLQLGIRQHQNELNVRDEIVKEKDKELLQLKTELSSKENEIMNLKSDLVQKNLKLSTRNEEIDTSEENILQRELVKNQKNQMHFENSLENLNNPSSLMDRQSNNFFQNNNDFEESFRSDKIITEQEKVNISNEICKILDNHSNILKSKKNKE